VSPLIPRVVKRSETESKREGARGWGKGDWGVGRLRVYSSVLQDEESWRLVDNTVNICNTVELYT
jgi:hypothetical protein